MEEIKYSFEKFSKALNKLEEAIYKVEDDLDRDGVIQRFEFVYELAWKTLKLILRNEGIICNSPNGCFKEGFKLGFIENADVWRQIKEDRNLTSHTYDEFTAITIFENIKNKYLNEFLNLHKKIKNYIKELDDAENSS